MKSDAVLVPHMHPDPSATRSWWRSGATVLLGALAAVTLAACGNDGVTAGSSGNSPPAQVALACDNSIKTGFKPDAQTSVIAVTSFKKGDTLPNAPFDNVTTVGADLCLVKLLVGPGNPGPAGAPSTSAGIGIEVWLPAKAAWNGRLHAVGNGGWAGSDESNPDRISTVSSASDFRSASTIAAQEGAVTANSDTGHNTPTPPGAVASGDFAMNPDGTINTTLWNDFASRAIHEQVIKAKALAIAYYGTAPKYTYWDGGSTGGRQALKQAQMYPDDFDGIISGFPAINWTKFITAEAYPQIVVQRDMGGAYPSADQLNLASNAAISACDMVGGQHLGFPLDPSVCRYDPTKDATVLCPTSGGTNATQACLSTVQAQAINKMWYGQTADGSVPDPAVDNGWATSPTGVQRWYGLARGTSMLALASPAPFTIATDQLALELEDPSVATPAFINATGNGADLWKTLSYSQLSNAFDRGVALQTSFGDINTDSPDLSAFKAHGGKLLHFHGDADIVIFPQGSVNYYDRVLSAMGGLASVQDFYRFYLIPGMSHGPGNGTANANANPPYPATGQMYKLLTDWVEQKIAPDNVVMTSQAAGPVQKSLPMCAYPKKATFSSGSPFVAASYVCS